MHHTNRSVINQPLPSTAASSHGHGSVLSDHHPAGSRKKDDANDDRPKWLREAQEQRAAVMSTSSAASPPSQPGPNHEIESRLAKLKAEMAEIKPASTDEELSARLARLRGQDPHAYAASRQPDHSIVRPQPRRTEAEEIEDLVAQMKERASLEDGDSDAELIRELESRLERLKAESAALGITNPPLLGRSPKRQRVPADDSDEEADRIVKMLSVNSPEAAATDGNMLEDEDEDEDDAFCVICPEEPTVMCLDCEDREKYCDRCFRECHREWAAMDHRTRRLPKCRNDF
ncbi:hypothetical protein BV898_09134 [Hypsibius exemplaris]|uniref:Zinc finger FYVE domain-containing protein 19 n=1 Tax=Hypsibius exemplaris TaxID=2072580 RepID=A0A1W0WNK2_HYPEX|nr:hypothetical protein BV898_09134 [Hypsibius exemplaris]